MGNLVKATNGGGYEVWSIGFAAFSQDGYRRSKIYVKCKIHGLETTEQARLDTGSTYTVISKEVVQPIGHLLTDCGEGGCETWEGQLEGRLVKLDMTLIAEGGENLVIRQGLALVSEEWGGPIVLGYHGFLDKIRIAIDPGNKPEDQLFYFGSCQKEVDEQ